MRADTGIADDREGGALARAAACATTATPLLPSLPEDSWLWPLWLPIGGSALPPAAVSLHGLGGCGTLVLYLCAAAAPTDQAPMWHLRVPVDATGSARCAWARKRGPHGASAQPHACRAGSLRTTRAAQVPSPPPCHPCPPPLMGVQPFACMQGGACMHMHACVGGCCRVAIPEAAHKQPPASPLPRSPARPASLPPLPSLPTKRTPAPKLPPAAGARSGRAVADWL